MRQCLIVGLILASQLPASRAAAQPLPAQPQPLGILNRKGEVTPLAGLPEGWTFIDPVISPDGKRIAMMASQTPAASRTEIFIYTLPWVRASSALD